MGTLEREVGRRGSTFPSGLSPPPQPFLCSPFERTAAEAVQRLQSSDPARLTPGAAELHACDMKAGLETDKLPVEARQADCQEVTCALPGMCNQALGQPAWLELRGSLQKPGRSCTALTTPKVHGHWEHQEGLGWTVHSSGAAWELQTAINGSPSWKWQAHVFNIIGFRALDKAIFVCVCVLAVHLISGYF